MMYSISAVALALSAFSATDAFVPKYYAFGMPRLSSSAVILQAEIRGPTEKAEGKCLMFRARQWMVLAMQRVVLDSR